MTGVGDGVGIYAVGHDLEDELQNEDLEGEGVVRGAVRAARYDLFQCHCHFIMVPFGCMYRRMYTGLYFSLYLTVSQ